jgi:hypothetical protein
MSDSYLLCPIFSKENVDSTKLLLDFGKALGSDFVAVLGANLVNDYFDTSVDL